MGEKKFTLMELHLDGETQFGPRTLPRLLAGTGDEAGEEETEGVGTSPLTEDTDESGGRGLFPFVAGLIAMVAIALAVRKYRSGDESESLEERDVVVS